jgi:hypothetical protein
MHRVSTSNVLVAIKSLAAAKGVIRSVSYYYIKIN